MNYDKQTIILVCRLIVNPFYTLQGNTVFCKVTTKFWTNGFYQDHTFQYASITITNMSFSPVKQNICSQLFCNMDSPGRSQIPVNSTFWTAETKFLFVTCRTVVFISVDVAMVFVFLYILLCNPAHSCVMPLDRNTTLHLSNFTLSLCILFLMGRPCTT